METTTGTCLDVRIRAQESLFSRSSDVNGVNGTTVYDYSGDDHGFFAVILSFSPLYVSIRDQHSSGYPW